MNYRIKDMFGPSLLLTKRELDAFSLGELIDGVAREDHAVTMRYREISDALQEKVGTLTSTHRSFYLPADYITRDLQVGSGSAGGYLVATEHAFASGLFNASLVGRLPLRALPLQGNVAIGTALTVDTAWQAGEAAQITHADPTFGMGPMTPKTVGAVVQLSRQLHVQLGADGYRFIEQQLGRALARAVDIGFVNGSGASGQVLGALGWSGTTSVSGTNLDFAGVRTMFAASEGFAADDLVFLAGINAAKLMRSREKAGGSGMVFADGRIDGAPVIVSRSVPTDALLLAPWSTVVMGVWSPIEVTISPYATSAGFAAGKVGVRLTWSIDFVPEHPAAISKATSIT